MSLLSWSKKVLIFTFSMMSVAGFAKGCRHSSGECKTVPFQSVPFTICEFDTELHALKLYLRDPSGRAFRHFISLKTHVEMNRMNLIFAMNGGMYHANRDPVGLFIENGAERSMINRNAGPGNFHLLPNGVFYLEGDIAGVADTEAYLASGIAPDFATQSGPMLVINGELHPRFIEDGTSRKIRNGVGVSDDGRTVTFVLSEEPVNFYDFGRLFRDRLKIRNALYLDGTISRMFSRELQRNDPGRAMGPIIGVVEQMPELPDWPDTLDFPAPIEWPHMEDRQPQTAQ